MEDQRCDLVDENGTTKKFPVGMSVLAVDDDPICLKVLETLLVKCEYQGLYLKLFCFSSSKFHFSLSLLDLHSSCVQLQVFYVPLSIVHLVMLCIKT